MNQTKTKGKIEASNLADSSQWNSFSVAFYLLTDKITWSWKITSTGTLALMAAKEIKCTEGKMEEKMHVSKLPHTGHQPADTGAGL